MDDVKERALNYLENHQVMTLATTGEEGVWAAAVFYVNVDFDFFFLSAGHTRHAHNFEVNPDVAATIQEDYKDWQGIQGIQLEGVVRQLDGDARETAVAHYRTKYPFLNQQDPQIEQAMAKVNWYLLQPRRLYLIDNRKGLGHRGEVPLSGYSESSI